MKGGKYLGRHFDNVYYIPKKKWSVFIMLIYTKIFIKVKNYEKNTDKILNIFLVCICFRINCNHPHNLIIDDYFPFSRYNFTVNWFYFEHWEDFSLTVWFHPFKFNLIK